MEAHLFNIILSAIVIVIYFVAKKVIAMLIFAFTEKSELKEGRAAIVVRYFHLLLVVLLFIILFTIWGVQKDNVLLTLTSIFTVIGVAMFAQWSLLSNVTAGILLFFSFPFRIGDIIRIQDKDFPNEARITDIKAFYVLLTTKDGELISYPNNLLLQKGIVILNSNFFDEKEKNEIN